MTEETSRSNWGCFPKVSSTWRTVFGTLTSGNRIHPSNPVPPIDSEFVVIESKVKIRVIHLTPEKVRHSLVINQEDSSKCSSVSEEYWFMKNKPLRNTTCSCSFRSSMRKSYQNVMSFNGPFQKDNLCDTSLGVSAENSTTDDVARFAEEIVDNILSEALNEWTRSTNCNGHDNTAYEQSEVDSVITRRKNIDKQNDKNGEILNNSSPANLKNCVHNRLKPLIMLIHGLGSTADIWNVLMHNLSFKGFEVVAPDLLGHGLSSAPNKACLYQFKSLLTQIMSVFDYFMKQDDKRKCILIGHSYGCSLITALYSNRATRIAQLILISGGGPTPLAPPADMNDISPYGWAHNLCYPFMYCGLKRSFFYSSRGKNFRFCEEESTVPPHIKEFLIRGQYWPEGDASFHRRILAPTLLVHGLQDKNVTLVQECEMERTIPRSFLELIPDAGHMAMLESPEHLIHMVGCFLDMWT